MSGRAPDPNDPIKNAPDILDPLFIWVAADSAGFKGHDRVVATSIALAESGGNAHSISRQNGNGTYDYGLMQINSVHSDLMGTYDWSVPFQSMQMAHILWQAKGGGFGDWSTYPSAAKLKENAAIAAIRKGGQDPDTGDASKIDPGLVDIGNAAVQAANPFGSLLDIVKKVTNIKTWMSVGFVILGSILISVAFYSMLGSDVLNTATKVLGSPAAKVAMKVVK